MELPTTKLQKRMNELERRITKKYKKKERKKHPYRKTRKKPDNIK